MNFVLEGSGQEGGRTPPLVFVHGFACAHADWRSQLNRFSSHHTVVACDLRGHGETPGRAQECTIANYGGDVAALLGTLELRGAVLVGHSMGCRVVLEAARLDPARIAGIVLLDGSMIGMGDAAQAEVALRKLREAADFAAFADTLFGGMFPEASGVSRAVIARAKALPADVGSALYRNFARWDIEHMRAALAAVGAPLLAIQSTWVNAERQRMSLSVGQTTPWLDLLRASVHGARIEVIANAGHFPQIERAQEVNQLLAGFVSSLGQGRVGAS